MIFTYPITIKEFHLDTFGHVNNAVYMEIFEEARWQRITENGYGLEVVQKLQKGPIILDCSIQFLKELKLREDITVTVETVMHKGKISKLEQKMIKSDGSIAAKAEYTVGFFDMVERKLISASPEWQKAIGVI